MTMKNTLVRIALFVFVLGAYSACGNDATSTSGGGNNTDPVLVARETKAECDNAAYTAINDEAGLMAINTSPDTLAGDYCLVASITLTATNWKPIGTENDPFMGNFDGNGHTITGLKINTPNSDNVGLFGVVGKTTNAATTGGIIQNLTIKDAHVTGKDKVGILVGRVYAEAIRRVAIEGGDVTGNTRVGGLVGYSSTTETKIQNSYTTATATATGKLAAIVGAFAGVFINAAVINSYAVNTFIGDVADSKPTITNSYCYGCTPVRGQDALNIISAANTEKRADADGVDKYYDTASTPKKEIFVGWDFQTIWRWNEGIKMPTLR